MKRLYRLIIAATLLLFMPILNAEAADSVKIVSESIDNSATGSCLIHIYAHGGSRTMGFRLHFDYPADKLRPSAAGKGSVTAKGTFTDNIGVEEGSFDILWNNTEEVSAEGELAVISAELLKANESFAVDVSFEQEDTFNEKYEDVVFNCEPIYTVDIAESVSSVTDASSADVALIAETVMKSAPEGELTAAQKQELVDRANADIVRSSGEKQYYENFDELSAEYGALLLDKLPQEAETLPTNLSAAEIIADVLTERGETEISTDNADVVTERFVTEGLDSDYGRYIDSEDIAKVYEDILEESGTVLPTDKTSKHGKADNLPYIVVAACIAVAAAGSGILLYYVRRRKNAQK